MFLGLWREVNARVYTLLTLDPFFGSVTCDILSADYS